MAQPEFVPTNPRDRLRVSERLPPPGPWFPDRPADLKGPQPTGPQLGSIGPDQGYALRLARAWEDKLVLAPGEHRADVVTGCTSVAMRRAALFGRAPVTYDLELAFAAWGYFANAGAELVSFRKPRFAGCDHDYLVRRSLVDQVPEATLRLTPPDVRARISAGGWRELLGVS